MQRLAITGSQERKSFRIQDTEEFKFLGACRGNLNYRTTLTGRITAITPDAEAIPIFGPRRHGALTSGSTSTSSSTRVVLSVAKVMVRTPKPNAKADRNLIPVTDCVQLS
eukprot:2646121-Rhodomonas_salina.2